MFRGRIRHVHFVGIGGVGMSGIAEVLLDHGFVVTGSDPRSSETVERLQSKGARTYAGHDARHIEGADVVVFSSAIGSENPELKAARQAGVPVIPRAEMLGELMRLKDGIAIAGSHGKTTTTSLVATVLRHARLDPTVIIGGRLNALGSGATRGAGDLLVAEADESDGSFLHLTPAIAVITNIDPEHLDHFGDLNNLLEAFAQFGSRVPFFGLVVACVDHPNVRAILPQIDRRIATYGFAADAEFRALGLQARGLSTRFEVHKDGDSLGVFEVNMPGVHNVQNALAAIAVADELNVHPDQTRQALSTFSGVQRRFSILGEAGGVVVVDDYGHHPTELQATLQAARSAFDRRTIVAFQPHRYTRTHRLFAEFVEVLQGADVVMLTDVYAAGEAPIDGATAAALAEAIRAAGHRDVTYVARRDQLATALRQKVRPHDLVITLGAGDITRTGPELLELLKLTAAATATATAAELSGA